MALRLTVGAAILAEGLAWNYPEFSWETLPVAFHSSNPAGPYSDEQLANISKYVSATFEKYQNLHELIEHGHDWENCQNGTDVSKCGCCVEDVMADMGKKLKQLNPKIMVLEYINSQQAYPWYRFGHAVAARPDLWLRNSSGDVILAGNGHWVFPDHSRPEGAALFEQGILNSTSTGFIDGAFVDGCAKSVHGAPAGFEDGKKAMLTRLQTEIPGVLICGSNGDVVDGLPASQIQNWGKGGHWSTREIPMLQRAVEKGAMFQAHGGCPENPDDQTIINDLSAFLVAAGPYSYYVCGGWNGAPTEWFEVYDRPLGKPLANASLSDAGVWTREFAHGTKVSFNTKTETGTITWGTKAVIV